MPIRAMHVQSGARKMKFTFRSQVICGYFEFPSRKYSEGRLVLSWLVVLVILAGYQHILQMFSTAARLVRTHLEFCKSRSQTLIFAALFRGMTYVTLTLCFKLISLFTLIFAVFKH